MIVYVDAPVLTGGVELVDTPGTGSVFTRDTQAAYDALETTDAAIFVLTADPPISASERDLLHRVAALSVTTFGARLAQVAIRGPDALAVVNGESGRLLLALNDAADEGAPRLRAAVGRKLDELLNGELQAASPVDIERVGRERLGALTVAEVSRWRADRMELMERGLTAGMIPDTGRRPALAPGR